MEVPKSGFVFTGSGYYVDFDLILILFAYPLSTMASLTSGGPEEVALTDALDQVGIDDAAVSTSEYKKKTKKKDKKLRTAAGKPAAEDEERVEDCARADWEVVDKSNKRGKNGNKEQPAPLEAGAGKGGSDDGQGEAAGKGKKAAKKGRIVKEKMEDKYNGTKRSKPAKPMKAKDLFVEEYIRSNAHLPTSAPAGGGSGGGGGGGRGGGKAAAAAAEAEDKYVRKGDALKAWAALSAEERAERSSSDEAAMAAYKVAYAQWEEEDRKRQEKARAHRQR